MGSPPPKIFVYEYNEKHMAIASVRTGSEKEISNVAILKMEIFFELNAQIKRIEETSNFPA